MQTVTYLPARYLRSEAESFFFSRVSHKVRMFTENLVDTFWGDDSEKKTTPYLEQLWMPWYVAEFITENRQGLGEVAVALDAWSGMIVLFDRKEALREGAPTEGDYLPSPFDEEKAMALARNGLFQVIMRRRGQLNKPLIKTCKKITLFYMPYWVCYYKRFFNYLDIQVMDAYTGKSAGARIRHGLLNALVAQTGRPND